MNKYLMNFLKVFLMLIVVLSIAKFNNEVYALEGDVGIVVYNGDGFTLMDEEHQFKGLSWDGKKMKLTLDNYKGSSIAIYKYESRDEDIEIEVKGENEVDATVINGTTWKGVVGIYNAYTNGIRFTGSGSLTISNKNNQTAFSELIESTGKVEIDGPTININGYVGEYSYNAIETSDFYMKSGTLNISVEMLKEYGNHGYCDIELVRLTKPLNSIHILGGRVIVSIDKECKYAEVFLVEYNLRKEDLSKTKFENDGYRYELSNCILVVAAEGNYSLFSSWANYTGDVSSSYVYVLPEVKYGENAYVIYCKSLDESAKIGLNNFKLEMEKGEFEYTGKAITPKVNVIGLKEGEDYTVKYENNIKPGKGKVIITGKGIFGGSITREFDITSNSIIKESENADSISDGKLVYKVLKQGDNKGIIGKVEVVGLMKKNLKTINIASTIKINGYKYKVVSIGENAFYGNKKIKKVSIGKNIKEIKAGAFAECKKLKRIVIKTTKLKKVSKKAYTGIKNVIIRVPKTKKKVYKRLFKKSHINCKIV
ncbi:Leucine rich repeat-containing protein [Eubacterium uniforme]|uniref:Leucine rich repeat-containing protein n=1 Tax=Eubacterium uniforme TaxID=39495 RepID=A0A1T4VDK6_9FIRM|nr:leucine-rich repeat protein [Eubacterium uniforme]SKA63040.1 Leucine rich repeat-containing protein [Eubacterium uniforme]